MIVVTALPAMPQEMISMMETWDAQLKETMEDSEKVQPTGGVNHELWPGDGFA